MNFSARLCMDICAIPNGSFSYDICSKKIKLQGLFVYPMQNRDHVTFCRLLPIPPANRLLGFLKCFRCC